MLFTEQDRRLRQLDRDDAGARTPLSKDSRHAHNCAVADRLVDDSITSFYSHASNLHIGLTKCASAAGDPAAARTNYFPLIASGDQRPSGARDVRPVGCLRGFGGALRGA